MYFAPLLRNGLSDYFETLHVSAAWAAWHFLFFDFGHWSRGLAAILDLMFLQSLLGTCFQMQTTLSPLHEMLSNFLRIVSIHNTPNSVSRFWISVLVTVLFDFDFDDFFHRIFSFI